MLQDLRHSLRMLRHTKAWTAVVVICLALGIGANAAMFGAINALVLEKLPVRDPDSLVRLKSVGPNQMSTLSSDYGYSAPVEGSREIRSTFTYPMFQQLKADNKTMSDLFACVPVSRMNVIVNGVADMASALLSTGNYYRVLGVNARLGRTIVPEDDEPSAAPVAVISERFWLARLGGDPNAVGQTIRVNGVAVTIVGVLPASFTGVQSVGAQAADIGLPLSLDPQLTTGASRLGNPTAWWLQVMGRLNPGVTPAQVEGNLGGVFQGTARAGLDQYLAGLTEAARANSFNQNRTAVPRLVVQAGNRGVYDLGRTDERMMTTLGIVVGLVLLIVCANVANLLLSRATARQKELAVRKALGATRGRLVRQLLTESLLLSALGGALGVLVAYWGQQLLPGRAGATAAIDARLVGFLIGLTTLTGVVFGIAPALRASRTIGEGLKDNARTVVATRTILSKGLLVVQVAVSLVLLVGAGLFLRTVQSLARVDVGFNPRNLVVFEVSPELNRYDRTRVPVFYTTLLERLEAVPGVESAAISNLALLSGFVSRTSLWIQGRAEPGTPPEAVHRIVASQSFFETMEIPLLAGRLFNDADTATSPRVVVINDVGAQKLFGDENPVGRRLGNSPEQPGTIEIIGVVRSQKYDSIREAAPPTIFMPATQGALGSAFVEVRTAGDPLAMVGALREAVRQIDPDMPVMNINTQEELVRSRFTQERLFARAFWLFGGLAVLVASVGLFGLMSYSVARRTNEIGIRMALGADPRSVLRLVMRESMILVVLGVAAGLAGAFGAGRFVASQLYGVTPVDPVSMTAATAALLLVSAAAAAIPARRAARVDPLVALRAD